VLSSHIVDDPCHLFVLAEGLLAVGDQAQALDYERQPHKCVVTLGARVDVAGYGGLDVMDSFAVRVTDTNEACTPLVTLLAVNEGAAPGTRVGSVSVADPDAGQVRGSGHLCSCWRLCGGVCRRGTAGSWQGWWMLLCVLFV
jgi:hypothetical protein